MEILDIVDENGIPTGEIRSERLLMRRYRLEDAKDLHEKFGTDPKMYEYSGWNPYASYEAAEETMRRFISDYAKKDFYGWAIEYRGSLVGTIGAYDFDPEKNQIEVGMSIARDSWGRGFATEALKAVLEYLTGHEGIRTVTAWCAPDNAGSMKAMQKAGMTKTFIKENALEVGGKTYDQQFFAYS